MGLEKDLSLKGFYEKYDSKKFEAFTQWFQEQAEAIQKDADSAYDKMPHLPSSWAKVSLAKGMTASAKLLSELAESKPLENNTTAEREAGLNQIKAALEKVENTIRQSRNVDLPYGEEAPGKELLESVENQTSTVADEISDLIDFDTRTRWNQRVDAFQKAHPTQRVTPNLLEQAKVNANVFQKSLDQYIENYGPYKAMPKDSLANLKKLSTALNGYRSSLNRVEIDFHNEQAAKDMYSALKKTGDYATEMYQSIEASLKEKIPSNFHDKLLQFAKGVPGSDGVCKGGSYGPINAIIQDANDLTDLLPSAGKPLKTLNADAMEAPNPKNLRPQKFTLKEESIARVRGLQYEQTSSGSLNHENFRNLMGKIQSLDTTVLKGVKGYNGTLNSDISMDLLQAELALEEVPSISELDFGPNSTTYNSQIAYRAKALTSLEDTTDSYLDYLAETQYDLIKAGNTDLANQIGELGKELSMYRNIFAGDLKTISETGLRTVQDQLTSWQQEKATTPIQYEDFAAEKFRNLDAINAENAKQEAQREKERLAAEEARRKAEAEKKAAEEKRLAEEKKAAEEKERKAQEEKAAAERKAQEEKERKAAEKKRIAAEKKAAREKAAAEKKAQEEKAAAEKKAAEEKAAAEKKAQEEKAAAEKKAAEEKAAARKKAEEEKTAVKERVAEAKRKSYRDLTDTLHFDFAGGAQYKEFGDPTQLNRALNNLERAFGDDVSLFRQIRGFQAEFAITPPGILDPYEAEDESLALRSAWLAKFDGLKEIADTADDLLQSSGYNREEKEALQERIDDLRQLRQFALEDGRAIYNARGIGSKELFGPEAKAPEKDDLNVIDTSRKPVENNDIDIKIDNGPDPQIQAALRPSKQQSVHAIADGRRAILNCAKELKNAKTFYNSKEYNNLISIMEAVGSGKPMKGLEDRSPQGKFADELYLIHKAAEKYLEHKTRDGVKANAFNKILAVEKASKVLEKCLEGFEKAPKNLTLALGGDPRDTTELKAVHHAKCGNMLTGIKQNNAIQQEKPVQKQEQGKGLMN